MPLITRVMTKGVLQFERPLDSGHYLSPLTRLLHAHDNQRHVVMLRRAGGEVITGLHDMID